MKKTHLIHVAWALAVAAAFVVGSHNRSENLPVGQNLGEELRFAVGGNEKAHLGAVGDSPQRADQDRGRGSVPGASEAPGVAELVERAFDDPNPLERSLAFATLLDMVDAENGKEIYHELKEKRLTHEQKPRG